MAQKKKKVDYEALASPFMRIPRMAVPVARDLLDIGLRQVYDLQGRAPEVLFAEARRIRPEVPEDEIRYYRMAVYFAENEFPDPSKLHPDAWSD